MPSRIDTLLTIVRSGSCLRSDSASRTTVLGGADDGNATYRPKNTDDGHLKELHRGEVRQAVDVLK